ncbi:MAG: hypothetical protein HYZ37_11390 [Candidatus Solibacter usitatus]|nr:hypothetical protein [Candidatus Solibacter usitatus]
MNVLLLYLAMLPQDPARFFDRQVAPILKRRCLACHNQQLNNGGISFQDRASLLKSGRHGRLVVPGKPDESYLLRTLSHKDEIKMPPGIPLSRKEILVIRKWIEQGAVLGCNPSPFMLC